MCLGACAAGWVRVAPRGCEVAHVLAFGVSLQLASPCGSLNTSDIGGESDALARSVAARVGVPVDSVVVLSAACSDRSGNVTLISGGGEGAGSAAGGSNQRRVQAASAGTVVVRFSLLRVPGSQLPALETTVR